MSYLLDTSVLIEIENDNPVIISQINALKDAPYAELAIPIFTFCEFYYGAINKSDKNRGKVLERLSLYRLINTSQRSGIIFCDLVHYLKNKGKPLPHFDVFIAAVAIEQGLTLIAMDEHFKELPHLKTVLLRH